MNNKKGLLVSVFLVILLCLLFLNMYLLIFTDIAEKTYTPVSFTYFMQTLESMPEMSVLFTNYNLIPDIVNDWGVFNFMRDFINFFTDVINVVIYCGQLLVALIVWISVMIARLFIGVV